MKKSARMRPGDVCENCNRVSKTGYKTEKDTIVGRLFDFVGTLNAGALSEKIGVTIITLIENAEIGLGDYIDNNLTQVVRLQPIADILREQIFLVL